MNIALIGNGDHSKRIQKILNKLLIKYFIYKPDSSNYFDKEEFEKVKKSDACFILSPNKSHFNYIKTLHEHCYLFCEKPPVVSKNEINKLLKLNNGKIYFNYNFRFSMLSDSIIKKNTFKLGRLLYGNITITHGLALKKNYKRNWRSDIRKCKKGVYELVSVHWIDFINYYFSIKKIKSPSLTNYSGIGSSYDTSHVELVLNNNGIINIFSSYNAPLTNKILFIFENGVIEQSENKLEVRGPAINLDKNNYFQKPKLIEKKIIKSNDDYDISLERSVKYFLKFVKTKKKFNKKIFDCSLQSNKLII